MKTLKACPFCGASAKLYQSEKDGNWYVQCSKFCLFGVSVSHADAIKTWNKRTDNELVEALSEVKRRAQHDVQPECELGGCVYCWIGIISGEAIAKHESKK